MAAYCLERRLKACCVGVSRKAITTHRGAPKSMASDQGVGRDDGYRRFCINMPWETFWI